MTYVHSLTLIGDLLGPVTRPITYGFHKNIEKKRHR